MTASLVSASIGIMVGYPGVALPQLNLNENEGSWFAAMDLIGQVSHQHLMIKIDL